MMLRARPQAIEKLEFGAILIKVGIAIAGEAAVAFAEREHRIGGRARARNFDRADIGLVIAQTLMFGREFGARLDRHAGLDRHIDHDLVQPLGMHIDLALPASSRNGVEYRLPENVTAFRNSALAMDAGGA